MATSTETAKRIAKLEREVLRVVLLRYRAWLKENPEGLLAKDDPRSNQKRYSWELASAAEALYKAKRK